MPQRHTRRRRITGRRSLSGRTGNAPPPRLAKVQATRLAIAHGLEKDEHAMRTAIKRLSSALGLD